LIFDFDFDIFAEKPVSFFGELFFLETICWYGSNLCTSAQFFDKLFNGKRRILLLKKRKRID
jgi:hypothetical protein